MPFLSRADDMGVHLPQQRVDLVDIRARAGAKTNVMQPNAPLLKALARKFGRSGLDTEGGARADEIGHVAAVEDALQPHRRHQL